MPLQAGAACESPSLGDCPLFDEEQPCLELLEGRLAELEAEA